MAYERLLERDQQPDNDTVRKKIGKEVLPIWDEVSRHLAENYPGYEPELIYYNPQHGWAYRYRKEAQQLCLLFPERGAFSALLILNEDEETRALEKVNYFNARIREVLNQPSSLPNGRWLWVRLEDHTDFVGLKMLLEIKAD